jgi:hypothetical protein
VIVKRLSGRRAPRPGPTPTSASAVSSAPLAMTHLGGPGPTIREHRPKAWRRCLNCSRTILTTAACRLCPACTLRAAQLAGGLDAVNWRLAAFGGRRS